MLLCLGLIEDALGRNAVFKSYAQGCGPFNLERQEIYKAGAILNAGVLYIARSGSLPEGFSADGDSALICIGTPRKAFLDSSVNILVFDESEDFEELSNEVGRIFFEYGALEQKLQEAVNKGRSIQRMVEIISPYLNGNEMLICNNDYRVIGKSGNNLHLNEVSGVGQPDAEGYLPSDIVTFFKNDIIFKNVRNLSEPFFYEQSIFSSRVLCMNVFTWGNTRAGLFWPRT